MPCTAHLQLPIDHSIASQTRANNAQARVVDAPQCNMLMLLETDTNVVQKQDTFHTPAQHTKIGSPTP